MEPRFPQIFWWIWCQSREEALSRGLPELVGYVLKDNGGMSKMMKKRGYKQTEDESDPHVNLFSLDLMNAADG